MIRPRGLASVVVLSLFFVVAPVAVYPQGDKGVAYESLLAKAKKGDATVDFKALRVAYFELHPSDGGQHDAKATQAMFAALNEKDYTKAIEYAENILKNNYVDIEAQLVAAVAYRDSNKPEQEKIHRFAANGLINSILSSGHGESLEKAFTVISTNEEYVILRVLGLSLKTQALLHADGHNYDRMDAVDPKTNETVTFYFNIDLPFGALEKGFKKSLGESIHPPVVRPAEKPRD
jgi:hypothetical protein